MAVVRAHFFFRIFFLFFIAPYLSVFVVRLVPHGFSARRVGGRRKETRAKDRETYPFPPAKDVPAALGRGQRETFRALADGNSPVRDAPSSHGVRKRGGHHCHGRLTANGLVSSRGSGEVGVRDPGLRRISPLPQTSLFSVSPGRLCEGEPRPDEGREGPKADSSPKLPTEGGNWNRGGSNELCFLNVGAMRRADTEGAKGSSRYLIPAGTGPESGEQDKRGRSCNRSTGRRASGASVSRISLPNPWMPGQETRAVRRRVSQR